MAYPGGKNGAGVYQKIINLMPPHDRYFEPFLGGGAILKLKRPALENVACDLEASQVSAVSAELARSGAAPGSIVNSDGARRSSKVAMPDPRSRIAESSERIRSSVPTVKDSTTGNSERIRYRLFEGCAIALLEKPSAFSARDLVYCDPPYLMETRGGRKLYEHELSDADHRRLLRCIRKLPSMVMISGYWSSLYAEMLQGWNSISFEAMTRGGHTATEWLWFNFPRPVELHDYQFLGKDFRERERIKRKKSRWTAKLRNMPRLERQALLCAIAETTGSGDAR